MTRPRAVRVRSRLRADDARGAHVIEAGQSIGNYRILSKIGTGGMGAVYLAEHPLIGKKVALKVIHRELAGNQDVVSRFFQEARAANAIGNEHIVEIHDFGVTGEGDHFYIMELVEGRTLASVLSREGAITAMRVLHIGAQIASALGAAHAAGVLHRDLKPDNIMLLARLGDPDFVKVLDFGLAKVFQGGGASIGGTGGPGRPPVTQAGVLLGTPQYMAPESCEGKGVLDHRADVYALGILLFEMATGRRPFDGDSMGEVLMKQVRSLPPAPRGFNAAIPPAVEQVILRCLAKLPERRFQTMAELHEALVDPDAYLRASPPISPARSVGPGELGVDAAGLRMHVEALARAKGPEPGPGRGASTGRNPLPGLAQPAAPLNQTMRIDTPAGHVSRPRRRVWPVVLVVGLLLGIGGGAFAVAWFDRDDAAPVAAMAPRAEASAVGHDAALALVATESMEDAAGGDAGGEPIDAPALAVAVAVATVPTVDAGTTATIALTTVPPGATVRAKGQTLGITPLTLRHQVGAVTLELRMSGYRTKTMTLEVTADRDVAVTLVKARAGGARPVGVGPGSNDTGLMRP